MHAAGENSVSRAAGESSTAPPPPAPRGWRGRLAGFALALTALLFAALVGEGALRVVFPEGLSGDLENDAYPWLAFDPLLAWRNRPGYVHDDFRIGALGLRTVETDSPPEPAAVRTLFLGDSRTFGIWLSEGRFRYDNDFPAHVARRARGALAVTNGGTIGYTSSQGLRQWLAVLDALEPEIVVATFGMNEQLPSWNADYRVHEPGSRLARALLYRFGGWRWVQGGLWLVHRPPWSASGPDWEPWVEPDEYTRNLGRFAEEATRRGVRLLFVDLPLRPIERGENRGTEGQENPWALYGVDSIEALHERHLRYGRLTRAAAERHGVPWVDAHTGMDRYRAAHPDAELFSAFDVVHPNRRGAGVVADLILDRMTALGWVPAAGDPPASR